MKLKLGSEILWLSEKDVTSLLSMSEALKAMENVFTLYGRGKVHMPSKVYLDFEPYGGDLRAMPAYIKGPNPAAGVKIVNSNAANPEKGLPAVSGVMVFNDPKTGLPLALLAAGSLTGIRTGAAGGLAAKYLARASSTRVGLVGCGRQSWTQLEALSKVFKLSNALVWGKTEKESRDFCAKAKSHFKFPLLPRATVQEVCAVDIIVTTTPVRTPVVQSAWVKPGVHINAIGADAPGKQELDGHLLKNSRVVVDAWEQASHAGEINNAVTNGSFSKDDIAAELGEIVAGLKKGRQSESDITIFDSTGLALQDVAVAQLVIKKALKLNKGKVLKFNG